MADMSNTLGNQELIARLQQREKEQSKIIAINECLAPITTR